MVFPWQLSYILSRYLLKSRLSGKRRFPLVLMLEPLFRCNLSCAGCGRIREYRDMREKVMSLEECISAVEEAGTPVVCLTGGEPLLHPDIGRITERIVEGQRFIYLATNGTLLEQSLEKFRPGPYFSFAVHLDGLAETHDAFAGRSGVFDAAVQGIRAAKKAGFQVRTNTTVYKGTDLGEIEKLFALLTGLGVDGIMVSPAFSYGAVEGDVFLSREDAARLFGPIYRLRKKFRLYNTPVYLQFVSGKRRLECMPWSNPARNPAGWRSPCYLLADRHYPSFQEMMVGTPWESYGVGREPRCANCMMHCGFEAAALGKVLKSPSALWETLRWNLFS